MDTNVIITIVYGLSSFVGIVVGMILHKVISDSLLKKDWEKFMKDWEKNKNKKNEEN